MLGLFLPTAVTKSWKSSIVASSGGSLSLQAQTTLLQSAFGLSEFRPGQREIIDAVLGRRDVMAVLPTGGGKSLCYQYPAMALQKLVIVVSPLIALMKDQVHGLRQRQIPAGALYSGQDLEEKRLLFREMQKGGPFVLYLSPERIQKPGFQQWLPQQNVGLFAIDEAHCVSQWGHDFRAEYAQLDVLKKLRPEVPTLALTASATPLVLQDIAKQLHLPTAERHVHGFYRSNLYFQVESCADEDEKQNFLMSAVDQFPTGRALVYCGTRKIVEAVAELLQKKTDGVGYYHAGLSSERRERTQVDYQQGRLRILVATNAFGMGVDQPDVRLVVHYNMPANLDSLSQEMGRAGRDGAPSTCLLLFALKDKGLQSFFITNSDAPEAIKNLRWRNLDTLVRYAEGGECRHAEILTYYRDAQRIRRCGHCDVCDPKSPRKVVTETPSLKFAKPLRDGKDGTQTKLRKKSRTAKEKLADQPMTDWQQESFESLKVWRRKRANELDVPAFLIFGDKTLREIAIRSPQNKAQLETVSGIGPNKLERFGDELLSILKNGE